MEIRVSTLLLLFSIVSLFFPDTAKILHGTLGDICAEVWSRFTPDPLLLLRKAEAWKIAERFYREWFSSDWLLCFLRILRNKLTSVSTTVLKTAVTEEGVYRIRRREKSGVIEVFKIEEQGTGKILSDEFLQWRQQLLAKQVATVAQLLQWRSDEPLAGCENASDQPGQINATRN
jgi:hypothetical protein